MNTTTSAGSVVLNDDLLCLILSELSVKQLVRLQTVSQQFLDCVGSALKSRNELTVGRELSEAFVRKEWLKESIHDLVQSHQTFASILKKCSNIRALHLNDCYIHFNTIEVIVNSCPHLKHLSLNWIYLSLDAPQEQWQRMAQLLSSLDSIELRIDIWFDVNFYYSGSLGAQDLRDQLCSLKSFHTNYYKKSIDECMDCKPHLSCSLRIKDMITELELHSLQDLIDGNEKLIHELVLIRGIDMDENNDIFELICDELNLKSLGFGATPSSDFEHNVFTENIVKQKSLRKLSIVCNLEFNANALKPMSSLRSLSLSGSNFEAKMWSNCRQVFPNLRHLTLNDINLLCFCGQQFGIGCDACIHRFMTCLTQLPQLTHLSIEDEDMEVLIACHNLKLFTELRVLDLSSFDSSDHIVNNLFDFCIHLIANKVSNKWFKLIVSSQVRQRLEQQLSDKHILIPNYFLIKTYK